MRNRVLVVVLVAIAIMTHGWPFGRTGSAPQDSEGTWSRPPRTFWPATMPPAEGIFRGLLAEIDVRFALHCRNGDVIQVEALEVATQTPYDPLPEALKLERDVISWGRYSLREWKTSRIDPFRLELRIQFRTDSTLDDNVVLYRVEYDLNGPDPGAFHPARIVITASPLDVAGWEKRVKDFRRHEEHVRRLREGRFPE